MKTFRLVAYGLLLLQTASGFSLLPKSVPSPPPSKIDTESWLDVLKYPGEPKFDVLQKSIEFASTTTPEEQKDYYDKDYVFRGSIVGPISFEEVIRAQGNFRIQDAFPDLQVRRFGFTIDPDNPYRCYWMERWEGTNTGTVEIGSVKLPPTNEPVKCPTHVVSANWTPEGKVIYYCLSPPLDRFEGNTQGVGAIFGLLRAAGSKTNVAVGDPFLRLQQRLIHLLEDFGRNWSKEEEIPDWWKSKSRGADPTDM